MKYFATFKDGEVLSVYRYNGEEFIAPVGDEVVGLYIENNGEDAYKNPHKYVLEEGKIKLDINKQAPPEIIYPSEKRLAEKRDMEASRERALLEDIKRKVKEELASELIDKDKATN